MKSKEEGNGNLGTEGGNMSAFIVTFDCINSIVTYLHANSSTFSWLKDRLKFDVSAAADVRALALALYRLNCDAIKERYGANALERDMIAAGRFHFRIVHRQPVEVFKAASCLLYQCSEGNVPEQDLF